MLHLFHIIFEHTIGMESDIWLTYCIRYVSSQLHEGVEHFAYFVDDAQVVNIGKSESLYIFVLSILFTQTTIIMECVLNYFKNYPMCAIQFVVHWKCIKLYNIILKLRSPHSNYSVRRHSLAVASLSPYTSNDMESDGGNFAKRFFNEHLVEKLYGRVNKNEYNT